MGREMCQKCWKKGAGVVDMMNAPFVSLSVYFAINAALSPSIYLSV